MEFNKIIKINKNKGNIIKWKNKVRRIWESKFYIRGRNWSNFKWENLQQIK